MARLLLVRHGESIWNASGRWQGWADPPLTELGLVQARDAATAAASWGPIARVVSSDLQRARLTAETIATLIGVDDVRVDPDVRERDVGEWSGLTRDEIRDQFPGSLPVDLAASFTDMVPPPGWEADASMLERVTAGLHRAVDGLGPDDTVLVVSHGGVVYLVEQSAGESRGRVANLSGVVLTVDDKTLTVGDRVELAPPQERTTNREL